MNRAQNTKKYLNERLRDLKDFASLERAKEEFFDSVRHFRSTIIQDLNKFRTLDSTDIKEFDDILLSIEKHRGQGGPNSPVYWNGTMPDYGKAQSKIYELIAKATNARVPIATKIIDLVIEAIATPVFVGGLILVLLAAILGLIIKAS
jgi:VIT1/CCC1 family predicted Fe2+/Mn2+ transporter